MAYKPSFEQKQTTLELGQFREESDSIGNVQAFPIGTIVALADNGDARFPELVLADRLESTVLAPTPPLKVASAIEVPLLNAATLQGKGRGTSGNTVPLLDGTNTWSADQLLSTTNKLLLDSSSQYLHASDSSTVALNAATALSLKIGGSEEVRLLANSLTMNNGAASVGFDWTVVSELDVFVDTVAQVTFTNGTFEPVTDNDILNGTSTKGWSGGFYSGPLRMNSAAELQFRGSSQRIFSVAPGFLSIDATTLFDMQIGGVAKFLLVGTGASFTVPVATTKQFQSTLATGTPPLIVASTTVVPNLSVEFLNGKRSTDFVLVKGPIETVTVDVTLTTSHAVVLCDASSAVITITLPAVSGNTGRQYTIKKIDSSANAVIVDGDGIEVIDDALTAVIDSQYESLTLICNGIAWYVL